MIIATLNARGLSNPNSPKYSLITQIIKKHKIDILVLTETNFTHQFPFRNYNIIQTFTELHSGGLTILINKNISISSTKITIPGRRIDLVLIKQQFSLSISAFYLPPKFSPEFQTILETDPHFTPDLAIGDFNTSLSIKDNPNFQVNSKSKSLYNYLKVHNLFDLADRCKDYSPTFITKRSRTIIDRILLKESISSELCKYRVILTPTEFDHNLVLTQLFKSKLDANSNSWILNSVLLESKKFVADVSRSMEKIMNRSNKQYANSRADLKWWAIKNQILKAIKSHQYKHLTTKNYSSILIDRLEKIGEKTNPQLLEAKATLSKYNEDLIKTIMEKHYSSLLRRNISVATSQLTKFLSSATLPPQTKITAIQSNDFFTFYKKLYSLESINERNRKLQLRNLLKSWLPDQSLKEPMKSLILPISKQEIKAFLKSTKLSILSSPGEDGLHYKFYVKFLPLLIDPLHKLFNYWITGGKIHERFKTANIINLYKKHDPKLPENWRPIALLNTDYKIFTAIINKRIKEFLPKLIMQNQRGFVDGRFIIDNIVILDSILLDRKNHYDILLLDIKKAFDTVYHKSILQILNHLRFPPEFVKIIKNIYLGATARVTHNKTASPTFKVQRGVKQGDPLSPTLFAIVMESLARALNASLQGFTKDKTQLKYLMFADDTNIFCKGKQDLPLAFNLLQQFEIATGLAISKEKTSYISMPLKRKPHPLLSNFNRLSQDNYLGYMFTNKGAVRSFDLLIKKLNERASKWAGIIADMRQRATIWNIYCLPVLWYNSWVLTIKKDELKTLENLQNWFIYHGNQPYEETTKYKKLMNKNREKFPLYKGGIGAIQIKSKIEAFHIILIERALRDNNDASKLILEPNSKFQSFIKKWEEISFQLVPIPIKKEYSTKETILEKYKIRKELDLLMNTRDVYQLLVDIKGRPSLTPAQEKFSQQIHGGIKQIWKQLPKLKINVKYKYLIWRYYQSLLPYDRSKVCNNCEGKIALSKKHIFFECPFVLKILSDIKRDMDKIMSENGFPLAATQWNERILHGIFQKPHNINITTYSSILYSIWLYHCQITHPNPYVSSLKQILLLRLEQDLSNKDLTNSNLIIFTQNQPSQNPINNLKKLKRKQGSTKKNYNYFKKRLNSIIMDKSQIKNPSRVKKSIKSISTPTISIEPIETEEARPSVEESTQQPVDYFNYIPCPLDTGTPLIFHHTPVLACIDSSTPTPLIIQLVKYFSNNDLQEPPAILLKDPLYVDSEISIQEIKRQATADHFIPKHKDHTYRTELPPFPHLLYGHYLNKYYSNNLTYPEILKLDPTELDQYIDDRWDTIIDNIARTIYRRRGGTYAAWMKNHSIPTNINSH